jgi:aspartyl-tRNA(Asn)/glutamyl-tRNA(Gln) amidotransferase subunit A
MASTTLPATILELSYHLRTREISPVQITRTVLDRIEQVNPQLGAFITVLADSAIADARAAEIEIAAGRWRGPLHGVPIALKDLIDTAGVRTTSGSELHKDRVPEVDARVVLRLKQAGAVILGKNNLHEFAYGGSSLVSYFGDVHNPWDVTRIAGGSSGGSAAAVAAGLCYAAIGTDTAGSIREPASLCGCVGLKPTYGRVSSRGVTPLSSSLDHVGPLATSVADAALVLQAIAGYDAVDIASCEVPVSDYVSALSEIVKPLRVGVARSYFFDNLDPETAAAVDEAVVVIKDLVAEVKEISLDVPTDRSLQAVEAYAYHQKEVAEMPAMFQPETLRRLRTGESVSAAEYIQRLRELAESRRSIGNVFADVDLIVTPTTPMPAPLISDLKAKPEDLRPAELRLLRNTRPFNVWGLPTISVPCGFTRTGLPVGLQIAGPHWRDDLVLRLAEAYEKATQGHKLRPKVGPDCS